MRTAVASTRVIRVPRIDEEGRLQPSVRVAGRPAIQPRDTAKTPAHVAGTPPMLFQLEGFAEAPVDFEPVNESARHTRETVARLLQPGRDDEALYSSALMAVKTHGSDLGAVASTLARTGYSVKLCSSAGGSLRSLKHTFITATQNTVINGEPAKWVIDSSFREAFAVSQPTPRYAYILSAVPTLLVAPLGRLLRAVLLLGAELARCFEKQDMPLPPWRHADSIVSKYDTVSSTLVSASSSGAMVVPRITPGAEAAARRQQARQQQQQQQVQLRLAKLGITRSHSPPSPSSMALDSPTSVLEAGVLSRAFANDTNKHERVCCGCRPFQPRQQPQLLTAACQAVDCAAASAA